MPFKIKHRNKDMEKPPNDEFGPVRDRRDFEPLQLSLKRILPCPSRELSFSIRGGCWRYSPSIAFSDRIRSIRESSAIPSTTRSTSNGWGDGYKSSSSRSTAEDDEWRTRKRLSALKLGEQTKRPRIKELANENANSCIEGKSTICRTAATVVTESTSSSTSTGRSSTFRPTTSVADVVPKAALYSLYGKRKIQIANKQYLIWNKGARTHELKCVTCVLMAWSVLSPRSRTSSHSQLLSGSQLYSYVQHHAKFSWRDDMARPISKTDTSYGTAKSRRLSMPQLPVRMTVTYSGMVKRRI